MTLFFLFDLTCHNFLYDIDFHNDMSLTVAFPRLRRHVYFPNFRWQGEILSWPSGRFCSEQYSELSWVKLCDINIESGVRSGIKAFGLQYPLDCTVHRNAVLIWMLTLIAFNWVKTANTVDTGLPSESETSRYYRGKRSTGCNQNIKIRLDHHYKLLITITTW